MEYDGLWLAAPLLLGILFYVAALVLRLLGFS
jgi:hypothetical protein